MQYDEFTAMNTTVLAAAEGDREKVSTAFAAVRAWVSECEARYSRFLPDSELSRLNRAAGQWFQASPGLFELIETALELHHLTDGLYDPSILLALQKAGYNRSMDRLRASGDQPADPLSPSATSGQFAETELDAGQSAIRLPADVQVDLGGLAKGWIVERAALLLEQDSPACLVDAGGDMVMRGFQSVGDGDPNSYVQSPLPGQSSRLAGPGWRVALEDPRHSDSILAVLNVGPGALVTSSVARRRWTQNGRPRHHIIDPRTGQPAQTAWLSVSVYAHRAVVAEAFAKALLLSTPQQAIHLARRMPELRFVAVNPDGSLWGAPESMEIIDVPEFAA